MCRTGALVDGGALSTRMETCGEWCGAYALLLNAYEGMLCGTREALKGLLGGEMR